MKKENQEIDESLKNLTIPSDSEMEEAWDTVDSFKKDYPKPDLNSVWNKVNDEIGESSSKAIALYKKVLRYAAIIIPLLLIGSAAFYTIQKVNNKLNYITYKAPYGTRSKINLSDGSTIWLQPNSEIQYPKKFSANAREIKFNGKGYFDIKTNPEKPFIIHTNNLDVSVLGTKFYVKADLTSDKVETGLISGKVKLNNFKVEQILMPNDVVIFSKSQNTFVETRSLANNGYSWDNGSLVFDDKPLGQVLKEISEWYNLEIESSLDVNSNVTITIREESINEIMDILQIVVPFNYKLEKDKLIVSGS